MGFELFGAVGWGNTNTVALKFPDPCRCLDGYDPVFERYDRLVYEIQQQL